MTTLADRPHSALLVIDVQNAVMSSAHDRDAVVDNVRQLVAKARAADTPVVWVQHSDDELPSGSDGWKVVPELAPQPSEPVVHKNFGDSFEDTDLAEVLASRGVGKLIVAGAQTDQCVRSTLHGAITRGYDTVLVSDAHSTEDLSAYGAPPPAQVIAHTNLYWAYQQAPGRTAGTATTAEVDFTAAS